MIVAHPASSDQRGSAFDDRTLPYGIFSPAGERPRVGVAVADLILDLAALIGGPEFDAPSLNPFMAAGPRRWAEVRAVVSERVCQGVSADDADVHRAGEVELLLPVEVADFVDFFSGIEHATNAGHVLRPNEEPLKPNYRHLPVGYHGRAGTVLVSGEDVYRPAGQVLTPGGPAEQHSARLDIEVELGYVVGVGSKRGTPVPASSFRDHVFGMVVLIDWSARDIQAWEYQPLGPFLGKSFATTISPWVVPLAALDDAWVNGPEQDPVPLPYLAVPEPRNLSVGLEVEINGQVVSRPTADGLYWSPAQQIAHMTLNGASLRTGDLYGTGTISSFDAASQGSLLELSWGGSRTVSVGTTERTYLEDGDAVTIRAFLRGDEARPLGEAFGVIRPTPGA